MKINPPPFDAFSMKKYQNQFLIHKCLTHI